MSYWSFGLVQQRSNPTTPSPDAAAREEEMEQQHPTTSTHKKRKRLKNQNQANDSDSIVEEEESGSPLATLTDLEVFDCSICTEPLTSPVFQCQNGHVACSTCCTKIRNKCPSCRLSIGDIRCLAIERVIESVKVTCANKPYGCKETVPYAQKHKHEDTCRYVPCKCPISVCDFRGTSRQLSIHFNCRHPSSAKSFKYNQRFTVSFDENEPYHIFQEEEDARLFVLSNQLELIGNAITMVCLGLKSLDVGYRYELISRKQSRTLKLKSQMEFVKEQNEASSLEGFLLIPPGFSSYGRVELDILIRKQARASCS